MKKGLIFRRAGAAVAQVQGPPAWYVKGSFVLDRLFGEALAADIDVFYAKNPRPPEEAEVQAWLEHRGFLLPVGAKIDRKGVDSLWACDGGDEPVFNVDCLFITMDGAVHEFDPATGEHHLRNPDAHVPPLARLDGRVPEARASLKALVKMLIYPPLRDVELGKHLAGIVAREVLDAPQVAGASLFQLHGWLEGNDAPDANAVRAAQKTIDGVL